MLDCTEERERSATSRHRKGRERSWRVRVCETEAEEEEDEAENCFRVSMIAESGFSLFLKGSSSPAGSLRRRFLMSAILSGK